MLSLKELRTYGDELVSENIIGLRYITLLESASVRNKKSTTGFIPKSTKSIKNACWADQWMALSGNYNGRCQCASCGKLLFANTFDPECILLANAYRTTGKDLNCTPESLQIQGGHIVLSKDITDGKFILAREGSTFIVPLCKECNNSSVRCIVLCRGSIITPEVV